MTLRPRSLAGRIAALFGACTVAVLGCIGWYLYGSLGLELARRDDAELLGKVALVRKLLSEVGSAPAVADSAQRFRDAMIGHEGLSLWLTDVRGQTLLRIGAEGEPPGSLTSVAAERLPVRADLERQQRDATTPNGRFVVAWGHTNGRDSDRVLITLARAATEREALSRDFGGHILVATLLGAALAALLGYVIARSAVRPVPLMTARANEISARRLTTRLPVPSSPTELGDLARAFNAMFDRLQEGVARLSQFSADLAHDLRTPINTLMIQAQVALSQARSTEHYQALIASSLEEYERLSRMIENTLFLARAENAQLAVNWQAIALDEELHRLRDYFEVLAAERGVTLSVSGHATLRADAILLQRALGNVLSNAIEHSASPGEVKIEAETLADGRVRVSVSNEGEPIAAEKLARVFDRYYRGDPSRAPHVTGFGLGLAIAKAIVMLHGGEIDIESTGGRRTIVRITFPAAAPSTPADQRGARGRRRAAAIVGRIGARRRA